MKTVVNRCVRPKTTTHSSMEDARVSKCSSPTVLIEIALIFFSTLPALLCMWNKHSSHASFLSLWFLQSLEIAFNKPLYSCAQCKDTNIQLDNQINELRLTEKISSSNFTCIPLVTNILEMFLLILRTKYVHLSTRALYPFKFTVYRKISVLQLSINRSKSSQHTNPVPYHCSSSFVGTFTTAIILILCRCKGLSALLLS